MQTDSFMATDSLESAPAGRKVAHLTSVHSPFDVRIFHKECKSIARAGYHVTLIACHDRDETQNGVQIRAVPKRTSRLARMISGVWSVYREAVRLDADLYHFHDPELLPIGLLLRMRGKIVVYDVHEDVSSDVVQKHYIPRGLRRLSASVVSLLERTVSRSFSAIVPATPRISQRFDGHCRSVVVSNFPVLERRQVTIERRWSERGSAVAYIGVLSRDRSIVDIVQAMSLLPENLPATLKLAGRFSPPRFQQELATMNGWRRVDSLGVLDHSAVAELLTDVRAGLSLMKPIQSFVESLPIKMFEYMAAGIPVVASHFAKFAEIIEGSRCGLLVDPDDPAAIARAIEFLLTHPDEAEEMGQRGRKAVLTKYNWSTEERKLIELYRTL